MKVGLQLPMFNWPGGAEVIGPNLAAIARTADEAGFASLWVMDHLFQIPPVGPAEDPMLECYTALGFMAAVTKRIRLGAMVTAVTYRHPAMLVKTISTLDVLSGGRAYLGIGAAWFEREAVGLGLPFPPLKERFERLEETLQIAHQMWSGDTTPYHGKHYQLEEPMNSPQALAKPHPPILIGGAGEKKTLRMVAQYADACNLFGFIGHDELIKKLDILKGHCEELGRDYNTIERTALVHAGMLPGGFTAEAIISFCRDLAALGFQHAILTGVPNVQALAPVEMIGREVIPVLADV